jgi:hypothetical protein
VSHEISNLIAFEWHNAAAMTSKNQKRKVNMTKKAVIAGAAIGKGGCKTSDNGCKGKNSCKGKGGCATDGSKPEASPH